MGGAPVNEPAAEPVREDKGVMDFEPETTGEQPSPTAKDEDRPVAPVAGGDACSPGRGMLCSGKASARRFHWGEYLGGKLSGVNTLGAKSLRHFTIYLRKWADCNYDWCDQTFRQDLLTELPAIGSGSFRIEILDDKAFDKKKAEVNRMTSGTDLFKQVENDLIFLGMEMQSAEAQFQTTTEKRHFTVEEFKKKLSPLFGTVSTDYQDLVVVVIVDPENPDTTMYAWADDKFKNDLRVELDNAGLQNVGNRSITIERRPLSGIAGCISLIDNCVYYKFGGVQDPQHCKAVISIYDGRGSLAQEEYLLDPEVKTIFRIGRGEKANKGNLPRTNDIIIKANETNPTVAGLNQCVSSAHADIIYKDGKFMLQAKPWGTEDYNNRTKIHRDEEVTYLTTSGMKETLRDGDIINLGNSVYLEFHIVN